MPRSIARRALVPLAVAATASLILLASPAVAHVGVSPDQAPANGYGTVNLSVPHGCGAEPTEALIVQLPESLQSVKAQAVPGWEVTYTTAELDEPYDNHGQTITEYVSEIEWRAVDQPLPTDQFLTFGISARWPDDPEAEILLPTIQECPGGLEETWIDPNADADGPAPRLTLVAGAGGHGVSAGEDAVSVPLTATVEDSGTDTLTIVALVISVVALALAGLTLVTARRTSS